jgi:hypothetical protein
MITTTHSFLKIVFVLIMVQNPANLPMALAAFTLIQSAAKNLRFNLNSIFQQTGDLASQLSNLRAIYAVSEIRNQVIDGAERLQNSREGICLEFKWVLAAMLMRTLLHRIQGMFPSNILETRATRCNACHSEFSKVNYV